MVENFIVIQLTFAEIFVPQDFTIKLLLGSVEPQTHVIYKYKHYLRQHCWRDQAWNLYKNDFVVEYL